MGIFILLFFCSLSVNLKSSAKLFNPCVLGEDGEELIFKFCRVNKKCPNFEVPSSSTLPSSRSIQAASAALWCSQQQIPAPAPFSHLCWAREERRNH